MSAIGSARSADRGLIDSTQWAVLIPLVLFVVLATIQAALWFAGRSTAQQAAMAAAEHAAFANSGVGDAQQVGADLAARGGLLEVSVQVGGTATAIEVQVSGRVPTLLPGDWSVVQASAHRIKEA